MKLVAIILLALLVVCLAVMLYLLASPLKLIVDSGRGVMCLGWNRWLHARVDEQDKQWWLVVNMPFWRRRYSIEKMVFSRRQKSKKVSAPSTKPKKRSKFSRKRIWRMMQCIKIRELSWELDTDDYVRNAYLTPVFQMLSLKRGFQTHINFIGRNEFRIVAQTRIINMLKASI